MKKTIILLIVAFLCFSLYSYNDDILKNVENRYKNFISFEATIIQTNYFTQLDYSLDSSGKVYMQNNNFVIEYQLPFYQFIKLKSGELTIYLDNEKTGIISNESDIYALAMFQFSKILNNDLNYFRKTANLLEFEVLTSIPNINNLRIFICEINELIEKIVYLDETENQVSIEFKNQLFNQPLSRDIDSFSIPSDASIIRQ